MRQIACALTLLVLAASPALPVSFNSNAAITADGEYAGSEELTFGSLVLWLKGTIDGATVTLQVRPFPATLEGGSPEWIDHPRCKVTLLPAVCVAAVGTHPVRLVVASAGGSTSIKAFGTDHPLQIGDASAIDRYVVVEDHDLSGGGETTTTPVTLPAGYYFVAYIASGIDGGEFIILQFDYGGTAGFQDILGAVDSEIASGSYGELKSLPAGRYRIRASTGTANVESVIVHAARMP